MHVSRLVFVIFHVEVWKLFLKYFISLKVRALKLIILTLFLAIILSLAIDTSFLNVCWSSYRLIVMS
jgi:hypothetical protein